MIQGHFPHPTELPVAVQFNPAFFVRSETFIYHYLNHMKQFLPVCLAWKLENLEHFSFPDENLYALQLKRFSPRWVYYGLLKRLIKRNLYFESILKKRNSRLIHAHFGHNGVQALKLKQNLDIPLVTTFYGADLSQRDVIVPLKEEYRKLFIQGDLFLVEGPHMKTVLQTLGCPGNKIAIQRIAVPFSKINFRPRQPKGDQTVKLIFCGRFTEKKGLFIALEAIKQLRLHYDRFTFCLIGDGHLKSRIKGYIQEHGMQDYVEMPGFLTYSEYLQRLESADIFVHPSITAEDGDSEGGAPTTILEAQAMGLPVISTFHADIPNVVLPNQSALLSPERDAAALTENIRHLLENQDLWETMGKTGRDFVEQYHDIKKETPQLEEKYRNIIDKRREVKALE